MEFSQTASQSASLQAEAASSQTASSQTASSQTASSSTSTAGNNIKLSTIPITDENSALTVMVGLVNLAQRRGAFTLEESAKLFECVNKFKHENG